MATSQRRSLVGSWRAAALFLVPCVAAFACSSSPGGAPAPGDDGGGDDAIAPADGSVISPADDGGGGDDGAAPAPTMSLRIANLSPDLPAVDVCIAAHGTGAFQGPLLANLATALALGDDAGLVTGASYGQVSAYVQVVASAYDVRLVASGSTSCDAALAIGAQATPPDFANLPSFGAGAAATLLIAGELSPVGNDAALTVTSMADDTVLPGGAALLRAVNAIPSAPAIDFGFGSASAWIPLFQAIPFAAADDKVAAGQGTVDANGYHPVGTLASQAMSARPSAADVATDIASAAAVEIDFGSIATVFAMGGRSGDLLHPPALLLCIDNQPAGALLADCSVPQ